MQQFKSNGISTNLVRYFGSLDLLTNQDWSKSYYTSNGKQDAFGFVQKLFIFEVIDGKLS